MHATIVQASGQRAQTYAIQSMHAIMIQTIDHRALQSSKQSITELLISAKNKMNIDAHIYRKK